MILRFANENMPKIFQNYDPDQKTFVKEDHNHN